MSDPNKDMSEMLKCICLVGFATDRTETDQKPKRGSTAKVGKQEIDIIVDELPNGILEGGTP